MTSATVLNTSRVLRVRENFDATIWSVQTRRLTMLNENSKDCSVGFPYHQVDGEEEPASRSLPNAADQLEFARWLISFIRGKDRCRITVDCIYLALGDAELEAITMTSVAASHGLTKAAISKRTKEIRRELHLSINANNKSPHAADRYSQTNRSPLRLDKST